MIFPQKHPNRIEYSHFTQNVLDISDAFVFPFSVIVVIVVDFTILFRSLLHVQILKILNLNLCETVFGFENLLCVCVFVSQFVYFILFLFFFSIFQNAVATINGSSFSISRVDRLNMGAYLCIASNGIPPTVSKRVMLIVHCKYNTPIFLLCFLAKKTSFK